MSNLRELYEVTVCYRENNKTAKEMMSERFAPLSSKARGNEIKGMLQNRFKSTFYHEPTKEEIEKLIIDTKGINIFTSHQISVIVNKFLVNY